MHIDYEALQSCLSVTARTYADGQANKMAERDDVTASEHIPAEAMTQFVHSFTETVAPIIAGLGKLLPELPQPVLPAPEPEIKSFDHLGAVFTEAGVSTDDLMPSQIMENELQDAIEVLEAKEQTDAGLEEHEEDMLKELRRAESDLDSGNAYFNDTAADEQINELVRLAGIPDWLTDAIEDREWENIYARIKNNANEITLGDETFYEMEQ